MSQSSRESMHEHPTARHDVRGGNGLEVRAGTAALHGGLRDFDGEAKSQGDT